MPTKKSDSDLVIPPSERMNSTVKNVNEGTERTLAYKIKKMEQNKEKFRKKSEQEQLMFAVQHMTVGNTQTQTAAERMLDEKRKMSLIAEEVDSRDVSSSEDDDDDSINDGPTWGGGGFGGFGNSKEDEDEEEEEDDTTEKEGPHKVNSGDSIDQQKMLDDLAKQPRYSRLLPSRSQTSADDDKHIINVFQKNTLDFKLLRDVAKTNEEIVSQIQYRRFSTDTPLAQKWKARAKKFDEEQEFNQRGAGKGRKTAFVAHLSKHKMSTANQLIMEPPQMPGGGRRGRCSLPALPRKSGMFNHKELEEARTPVRLWLNALDDINAGKLERNEKQEKEREIELQKKVIDVWQRRRSISVDNPILSLNANRRRSVSVGDSPLTSRARPTSTKNNEKGSADVPSTTAPPTRRMERRVSFVKFLPKSQQTEILKEAQKMK